MKLSIFLVVKMEVDESEMIMDVAPEFLENLQAQTADSGTEIRLECVVAAKDSSDLEVHWMKDGKEVKKDSRHELQSIPDRSDIQKLTLLISKSESRDAGKYECIVKNKVGSAKTGAPLAIQGKTSYKFSFTIGTEFIGGCLLKTQDSQVCANFFATFSFIDFLVYG